VSPNPQAQKTVEERFWEKVKKTDGCWVWKGANFWGTYGHFWMDGKVQQAHRASWQIHFGPIPAGKDVLHQCDNPSCVRPEHLYLGTQFENAMDAERRGRARHPKGEDHGEAKLTADQVRSIRRLYYAGCGGLTDLAKQFNVTKQNIRMIVLGRSWKHLV
jgi:hypothetical protein